ncbi:Uncharacterized protein conserved in bacteria [Prochlorococcus marinus str. MIT 9515]|uniref:Uncharacterized protein conserved in bacteria n=1 Tax=Prochlorococcus marinus (strain MIT 9515) TaxID=167542 RepID=A2BYW9_PROM5|nr:lipid-A-disaccharide synthase-related protein [Prochlorococcus marinus]ABM72980.1 Uncharacterized protein conserved in bacteria [Prochlorococcus marinus str. MIT 9515]
MQSSALPLGHAADRDFVESPNDPTSNPSQSLLIICNGHGEDVIALEIIKRFLKKIKIKTIEVMPLVGNGKVFDSIQSKNFSKIGHLAELPSGGFSNQSVKGFILDLFAGFLIHNLKNFLIIRGKAKDHYKIIAVGDLLPLFFAWSSKCEFSFIGTPKSDHTWSSGPGWSLSDFYHKFKGSEWDPWEMYLMRSTKCKSLIMRDEITANNLNKKKISAKYFGNPMMDFVDKKNEKNTNLVKDKRIILLIGSRFPEALHNLDVFLDCLEDLKLSTDLIILLPLSTNANVITIKKHLINNGYSKQRNNQFMVGENSVWKNKDKYILLGKSTFHKWANMASVGLSNAGTATEQITGLGVPSVSLPGAGPQFTKSFAKRQSRLLGGSVLVCDNKKTLVDNLEILINKKHHRLKQVKIGMKRMGKSGASKKIVEYINLSLLA